MSSNERTLKDVLAQIVASKPIHDRYHQVKLKDKWRALMGDTIAEYTNDIRLYKGTLTIVVSSSPLRQQLSWSKPKIIEVLNKAMGDNLIEEVRIF